MVRLICTLLIVATGIGPACHRVTAEDSGQVASDWIDLFDGETLDGWQALPEDVGAKQWWIQQGTIITENDGGKGSNLWTTQNYRDYELTVEFKTLSEYYDTGVFLRGDGHQVQIGISGSLQKDMTACLYAPQDKRGKYPGQTDKVSEVNRVGQWNELRIVLSGKRIKTFLNGQPMIDYESVAIKDQGPIGLQLHGGHKMKIAFRSIKVRKLND